jgi:hypothetical protein
MDIFICDYSSVPEFVRGMEFKIDQLYARFSISLIIWDAINLWTTDISFPA